MALRAVSSPAGSPVSGPGSLSCHMVTEVSLGMAHPMQMGEGDTSGFLFLQLSSLPPCWWEQGHSAIWSLFAVGGLQGGSEEKACWVRVPVLRLGCVQLHSTCLVRMGARWSPCKGTGGLLCTANCCVLSWPV